MAAKAAPVLFAALLKLHLLVYGSLAYCPWLIPGALPNLPHFDEKTVDHCDPDTVYAEFFKGRCRCREGFTMQNGTCIPTEYHCPQGQALQKGGQVVFCDINIPEWPKTLTKDSCPPEYRCFLHVKAKSSSGNAAGHCCPASNKTPWNINVCPVGKALPWVICPDLFQLPMDKSLLGGFHTCPHSTHECVGSACCPSPCPASNMQFNFNGKCVVTVTLDDECQADAMCFANAKCLPTRKGKKTCQCPDGYLKDTSMGYTVCKMKAMANSK